MLRGNKNNLKDVRRPPISVSLKCFFYFREVISSEICCASSLFYGEDASSLCHRADTNTILVENYIATCSFFEEREFIWLNSHERDKMFDEELCAD